MKNIKKKKQLDLNNCSLLNEQKTPFDLNSIASNQISSKQDLFVEEISQEKKKCTRFGCGKEYVDSENVENCCKFHPGHPIFHEGYKKWSCCSKTGYTDFDEFLNEPGCAEGFHTDERQKKPAFMRQEKGDSKLVSNSEEKEVYKTSAVMPPTNIPPLPPKPTVEKVEEELDDPVDAVIPVGAPCLRNGCKVSYVDHSSRTEKCIYHPGIPLFHEGSKGWTCCKPKVLDFSDFLKIEGCQEGKHKFVKKKTDEELVQCKYDWFQVPSAVTVTIYAKKVLKEESQITFDVFKLNINLKFQDGKFFRKEIILSNAINPETSKYEILSTKVECKLMKATGDQWTNLEAK